MNSIGPKIFRWRWNQLSIPPLKASDGQIEAWYEFLKEKFDDIWKKSKYWRMATNSDTKKIPQDGKTSCHER